MAQLQINKPLPQDLLDVHILSENGDEHKLGDVLSKVPSVVVFVRHFGCIGCTMQMNTIGTRIKEIASLGVQVIVIGNGEPHYIEDFKERHRLQKKPVKVFTDPSLQVYKQAQLKRNFLIALGPTTWYEFLIAWSKGIGQSSIEGDNGQMGGTMFIDESSTLRFYYRNKTVANHADPNELMDKIYLYIGSRQDIHS